MRRPHYLLLSLVVLTALVLAACGDDDSSTDHRSEAGMPMDMGDGMGGGMGPMGHRDDSPVADGARQIEVRATSFSFDPDEITATVGEDIAIVLTSEDILHDFTIDELDAHVTADAGDTEEGGFRADEPGTFTFYCTVAGHREAGMEGTLVVEPG